MESDLEGERKGRRRAHDPLVCVLVKKMSSEDVHEGRAREPLLWRRWGESRFSWGGTAGRPVTPPDALSIRSREVVG